MTKASFPRLNGLPETGSLTIDVGCWANPCSLASTANVFTVLYGARVTISDASRPAVSADPHSGLYGGGSHGGDESVRFSAGDNVGVRRAELIDLTDPANARVVGRKDNGCDFSLMRPCTNFKGALIKPSSRLPSGTRTLAVRVTDTAGNQSTTPPRGSLVAGPLNGSNASASGRLRAVFSTGGKTRRTVKPGGQPGVSISLRDGAKHSIGGARIQVRARQLRTGAHFTSMREVRTSARGNAHLVLPKGPSRELRFEYRMRVDDQSPALGARMRLGVRPRATLRVRPKASATAARFGSRAACAAARCRGRES